MHRFRLRINFAVLRPNNRVFGRVTAKIPLALCQEPSKAVHSRRNSYFSRTANLIQANSAVRRLTAITGRYKSKS